MHTNVLPPPLSPHLESCHHCWDKGQPAHTKCKHCLLPWHTLCLSVDGEHCDKCFLKLKLDVNAHVLANAVVDQRKMTTFLCLFLTTCQNQAIQESCKKFRTLLPQTVTQKPSFDAKWDQAVQVVCLLTHSQRAMLLTNFNHFNTQEQAAMAQIISQ